MSNTRIPSNPADQPIPNNYEDACTELEALVAQMESNQLPLEQLLISYERGAYLLGYCQSKLQVLEEQISVIDNAQLRPWRDKR